MKITREQLCNRENNLLHIIIMYALADNVALVESIVEAGSVEVKLTLNDKEVVDLEGFISGWQKQIDEVFEREIAQHVSEKCLAEIDRIRSVADQIEEYCVSNGLVCHD